MELYILNIFKYLRKIFLITVLLISATIAKSQGTIQGTVMQNDSTPLAGVSVYLENTKIGTHTNSLGNYKLEKIPQGDYILVISSVGYKKTTQTVQVKNNEIASFSAIVHETINELNEFSVTATSITGGNIGVKKMPGSAYYISPKELERFSYSDINRSLRTVPGVNLTEEDGFGLRTNIGLRGTGTERSSKITVMEDGILVAPAPYASPAAYYFPTAGRIQSIEIMKGSSQIKYGPFTTGGAINLISTQIPNEFSGKLDILAGSFDFKQVHANVGASHKNFAYVVETFQYGSGDGFKELDVDGNTGFDKKDYMAKFRVNTNSTAKVYQSLTFKIGQADEVSDETYLGLTKEDFNKNHLRRYAGSQNDVMTTQQRNYSVAHLIKPAKFININTTAYYTEFGRNWYKLNNLTDTSGKKVSIEDLLQNPDANAELMQVVKGFTSANDNALTVRANNRNYESKGIQSAIGLNFNTNKMTHTIDLGIRYHEDEMDRFQWDDKFKMVDGEMLLTKAGVPGTESNRIESAKAIATFIQYKLNYKKITFTPGVRYENIELTRKDYGKNDVTRTGANLKERENKVDVVVPGASLDYHWNKSLTLFTGVHKGFAPPGNTPDVDPEESINYELGGSYYKNAFTLKLVGFFNDYENLLGSDLAASGGSGTNDLFNGGKAETKGIEFFVSYDFLSTFNKNYRLPLTLTYTYMDATFKNSFESSFEPWKKVTSGDQLPYFAENQFNIQLAFETPKYSLNVRANYTDEMRTIAGSGDILDDFKTDSYIVFDASASYRLQKYVNLFASVSNIFDNEYAVATRPAGYRPGMPRMFMVGLKTHF